MPKIETYRKRAKQIVRWHRERNYSVGGKARQLARFRALTDAEVLAMPMPLTLAQEIVAAEAGFANWATLRASLDGMPQERTNEEGLPALRPAVPILFVRSVADAAEFYASRLGFGIDFLHGHPAFYGSVSRGGACLHLRHVHEPYFAAFAEREEGLILATVEVSNVKALFAEFRGRGVEFAQPLQRQAWGGLDFHVRDPAGNVISFVAYEVPAET